MVSKPSPNSELPWCVIGAGPCGLAALQALAVEGIPAEALERADEVGGNWYYGSPASSVYRSAHLISSKRLTQFPDFPMPAEFPPYPSQQQVGEYLRGFARTQGLYDRIRFRTEVEKIEPLGVAGEGWRVKLRDGTTRNYSGVFICNGHHWHPRWPNYPGEFTGEVLHSRDYKTPEIFHGKRVLVVGAGNSGCDIAVEAAQHAESALISLRRGYHFLPKFIFGKPVDEAGIRLQKWHFPLWLRRTTAAILGRIAMGPPQMFGLPTPRHSLFESHPIVNSQLFFQLGHGRLKVKPDIARLDGSLVQFTDETSATIDLIVYATGYEVKFPFLDAGLLPWKEELPSLYLHAFHPQRDDLFVIGMIQPNGGLWPLAQLQAKIAAAFLAAKAQGAETANRFARLKSEPSPHLNGGIHFLASPRHKLEVDYYTYRKHLRKLLLTFGPPR